MFTFTDAVVEVDLTGSHVLYITDEALLSSSSGSKCYITDEALLSSSSGSKCRAYITVSATSDAFLSDDVLSSLSTHSIAFTDVYCNQRQLYTVTFCVRCVLSASFFQCLHKLLLVEYQESQPVCKISARVSVEYVS